MMTILTNVGMNVIVQSCFDVVQWSDNERKRLNENYQSNQVIIIIIQDQYYSDAEDSIISIFHVTDGATRMIVTCGRTVP